MDSVYCPAWLDKCNYISRIWFITTHQVETYFHHWAKTCPVVKQRYCILNDDSSSFLLSDKDTIYLSVRVFGSMKKEFEVSLLWDCVWGHVIKRNWSMVHGLLVQIVTRPITRVDIACLSVEEQTYVTVHCMLPSVVLCTGSTSNACNM